MVVPLFEDCYAPITSEIGFLECNAAAAAHAYVEWGRPIQAERGVREDIVEMCGTLISKIRYLLPLTDIERRRTLFVPTRSNWTAYFDNGWRGTDAYSAVSYLCEQIGCRGIRAVYVPHTLRGPRTNEKGRYGATIFELYAPNTEGCFFLNTQRSIFAVNDGSRWQFEANGTPLPFEASEHYQASRIRARFTPELLDSYLGALGIHFFSANFYDVQQQPAYLVSKVGPCAAGMKTYSLEEARSYF